MADRFDPHFQLCFCAHLLRDSAFLRDVADDVSPEWFSNEYLQRIVRLILDHYAKERASPDTLLFHMLDKLKEDGLLKEDLFAVLDKMVDGLFSIQLSNRDYLLKEFDSFARFHKINAAFPDFADAVKKGEFGDAEQVMRKAFRFRDREIDKGAFYTEDPTERISRRLREDEKRCWTMAPELDQYVEGLRVGEIGLLQSQKSSVGKSAALAFFARSFVFQKLNVLIYTLEMSRGAYEDRLDQLMADLQRSELDNADAIRRRSKRYLNGRLYIKHLPAYTTTMGKLREHTDYLRASECFIPDVVLIDYIDLLGPDDKRLRGDLYATGQEVMASWLGWAQEAGFASWSATQSTRAAADKTTADQQDVSQSIAKSQFAHVILSLNVDQADKDKNIVRMRVVKNREGAKDMDLKVYTDFSTMTFRIFPDKL